VWRVILEKTYMRVGEGGIVMRMGEGVILMRVGEGGNIRENIMYFI
jgi:hypothetical protein